MNTARKDRILSNILFFFGLILLVFNLGVFIYQIVLVVQIDWSAFPTHDDLVELRSYVIIEFVTSAFKFILSMYAMYSLKHVDEAINPLFTFTIFYGIFTILQMMSFVQNGGVAEQGVYLLSTGIVDLVIAFFLLVVTLLLKVDDWRSQAED